MGLGGGRLVEHGRCGGSPVDEQGVALGVAESDPADVARSRVELLPHVEAPEDEPFVRCVELGDPLRGLEDHRVALDEAALVAEPAALVALAGQRLRGRGRVSELTVDTVDELLLPSDLALDELL